MQLRSQLYAGDKAMLAESLALIQQAAAMIFQAIEPEVAVRA